MKLFWRLTQLVILVAVCFWIWSVLFPSPEKIIHKQLAGLAHAASFVANEGPLARANNVARLTSFFSADAQLNVDVPDRGTQTLRGRDEIMQAAIYARSAGALTVEFHDVSVRLAADKQSAAVDVAVTARTSGDRDFLVQEMKIAMKKIDGKWLVTRVETVKTLSSAKGGQGMA
jgi:hypothetical protein